MPENYECADQYNDEDGESEKGRDELKDFGVLKRPRCALLLGVHEHREFFVQGDQRFDVVFELESQPVRFLRLPESRELLKSVRIRFAQAAVAPKGRAFLCPKP